MKLLFQLLYKFNIKYYQIHRAIINHYIPKIDNWLEKNAVTTPVGEDVSSYFTCTYKDTCLIMLFYLL